jgi:AGZA family xanthine/uracil permease-like MFS transporter
MKAFVRGDVDGFFAIALDNTVQLLLIPALCVGVVGMAPAMVYGRILPGIAVAYIGGNLIYAWQAQRLSRKENRIDVCAMPFGLNTPTMIAYAFLVMAPARQLAVAHAVADPDRAAWQAGIAACLGSGIIEFFGSFIADWLRKLTPRAALLASLSGAGFAFLALNFMFDLMAHPIVGIVTLGLTLLFFFSGMRPKGGIPAAFVVLAVGTALSWMTGLAPGASVIPGSLGLHLPRFVGGDLARAMGGGQFLPYLPIILPMGLLNLLASMQCVESAAAAGDSYSMRSSLLTNGLCTLVSAFFGSPFPTSIYIGHPAWKRMGARAGYSTLNAVFMTAVCFTGSLAAIGWAVPVEAGVAIFIWIGIIITCQAFEATPRAHWPAVVMGMLPVMVSWATFNIKNGIRIAEAGAQFSFTHPLVERFHASGTFIDGGFAVEQGAFFAALIFSAATVMIIEHRLFAAAGWMLAAAVLSLLGLMDSWQFSGADTISSLPILERIAGHGGGGGLFPAADYTLGYLILAAMLCAAKWFARPGGPPSPTSELV